MGSLTLLRKPKGALLRPYYYLPLFVFPNFKGLYLLNFSKYQYTAA